VFGLFAMTLAVRPGMRTRRKRRIFNITSVAGLSAFRIHRFMRSASRRRKAGRTGSPRKSNRWESKSPAEPGPFRTGWAGRSLKRKTPSTVADHADTAAARTRSASNGSGKQAGEAALAAQAVIDLVDFPIPPHHLVPGTWACPKSPMILQTRWPK
jgi:NAD(P)-dependent dehydrogenase (short-subunit alcohol dehydrogenase family)